MKTIAAAFLALAVLTGTASARPIDNLFTDLEQSAPRSVFDDLGNSAPRSLFDDINSSAPHSVFDGVQDSAPRSVTGNGSSLDLSGE